MQWISLLALALAAPYAHALLRFPCSQLVVQRFDPLVTPGQVSPHLHQIVGGNAFDLSMPVDNDIPSMSTCTSCRFKEDFSNYWTAVLFFKHPNGSMTRVPQMANQFTGSPTGGITVYYIQPQGGQRVQAFRKGFRMIVGDPKLRNRNLPANSAASNSLTFRCFSANFGNSTAAPGGGSDTVTLPPRACAGGIRSNIYFPSCWDGVTLDPPDHSSHVAWPQGNFAPGSLFFPSGTCPSTHPVRIPQLFYEIVWDTRAFNSMWPTDGSQPFVLSYGDPTGYGQHGDYVFGWRDDSLQRAMDTCTDIGGVPEQCRALTINSDAEINRCTQPVRVPENNDGYLPRLPGCNPIQNGPGDATPVPNCDAVSTTGGGPGPTPTSASRPPVSSSRPPVSSATPTPQPSQPGTVPRWGQCGGIGWTGGTQCVSGTTCTRVNDWYFQCL